MIELYFGSFRCWTIYGFNGVLQFFIDVGGRCINYFLYLECIFYVNILVRYESQ